MLSCDVITDLQVVYASGEASAETRRLVEEHLAQCANCRAAFGRTSPIEKELPLPEAKPTNGTRFITRMRRLFFAIIGGLLLVSALLWALFEHVVMQNSSGLALPNLPGSELAWIALACAALLIYLALLRRSGTSTLPNAVLVGTVFLLLGILTFQLIASASAFGVASGVGILAIAVISTFAMLPRLPNVTLVTILVLLVVNALLFGRAVSGLMQIFPVADYMTELPGELGHPAQGVALDDAARIDLRSLGLEWQKSERVTVIDNNWVGSGQAVQSVYAGNGGQVSLTLVYFQAQADADQFFVNWERSTSQGVHLMRRSIHLPGVPGQGNFTRSYGFQASTAFVAWQNENWVTIIEAPGVYGQAIPLATAVEEAVARHYQSSAK